MEFPIKFDKFKSEWSIILSRWSLVIALIFFSPKIDLVLPNSVCPVEMPHNAPVHLSFALLPKYPFGGCLTHMSTVLFLLDEGKHCRPRPDATERGV